MAAQRKPRLPAGDVIKLDETSNLDRLTTKGVKSYVVAETERGNPETSIALVSRGMESRQPVNEHKKEMRLWYEWHWEIYESQPGKKWCCQCDRWKPLDQFTKKTENRDGKHSHCNECRASHARKMYWLKKEAAQAMPMAA